jgi:hypothetical protein
MPIDSGFDFLPVIRFRKELPAPSINLPPSAFLNKYRSRFIKPAKYSVLLTRIIIPPPDRDLQLCHMSPEIDWERLAGWIGELRIGIWQ